MKWTVNQLIYFTYSIISFIFQIVQITISNILIEKSVLVFVIYFLPILFITLILITVFIDNIRIIDNFRLY